MTNWLKHFCAELGKGILAVTGYIVVLLFLRWVGFFEAMDLGDPSLKQIFGLAVILFLAS